MANTAIRLGPLSTTGTGGGTQTGYLRTFSAAGWSAVGDDYQIQVLQTEHLKGTNPVVNVYELDGVYSSVHVSVEVNASGDVTIKVPIIPDNRFEGKLIIS